MNLYINLYLVTRVLHNKTKQLLYTAESGFLQYLSNKSPEEHSVVCIRLQWLIVIILSIISSLTPCFIVRLCSISDNKVLIFIKIISSKLESDVCCGNRRFMGLFIRHQILWCKTCWWVNNTDIVCAECYDDDMKESARL